MPRHRAVTLLALAVALGPAAEGTARILPPEQEEGAERAIQAYFGLGRRMYEGVAMNLGPDGVYLEVTPS